MGCGESGDSGELWRLEQGELRSIRACVLRAIPGGGRRSWCLPQASHPILLIPMFSLPNAVACPKEAHSTLLWETVYFSFLCGPTYLLEREPLLKTGSTHHTRVLPILNWHLFLAG